MLPSSSLFGSVEKCSLLNFLRARDEFNAEIVEHVDLLNNLLEQRRSIELLPDADCRMAQQHPQWKNRIKSQLDILLTDAIIDFRNESLYSKLAIFLSQVEQVLEDHQSNRCSLTFVDDFRAVHTDLKCIYDYYEKKLDDCAPPTPPEKLETKSNLVEKKSKKGEIDQKKVGESYHVCKALERLEYDLNILAYE